MDNFEFYNPVKIIFGAGQVNQIAKVSAEIGKKALLVSYREHSFFADLLRKIESDLKSNGLDVVPFYQVQANPHIGDCRNGVELARKEKIDMVIGIGGGSAMDSAKVIAAGVKYQGDLWNMVVSRHDNVTTVFPHEALPMVMVPTLPATGSEMNCCGVVTNEKTTEKSYVWDPCLYPKVSIVDPQLTCSLPEYQTACGAADTISHVMEFYLNGLEDTPLNNRIQEAVMLTVMEQVPRVLKNPNDLSARGNLQWASIVALNGWSQPGDAWTPMHQLGHVLSARYNVTHGATLAIIMPAWMKTLNAKRPECYLRFAREVMKVNSNGLSDQQIIDAGIKAFEDFLNQIGVPTRLPHVKVAESAIEDIVNDVVKISFGADGKLNSHPPVSKEEVTQVFQNAL